MNRILRRILIGVLALLVGVGVVLTVVVATEPGTRFAFERARALLPESVGLGEVDGRFAGPLVLHDIAMETPTMRVEVDRIELRWRPGALFDASLHVERIAIDGVRYTALPGEAPPPPESEPFELPERIELPVAVRLDTLTVTDVAIRTAPDTPPIEIERAGVSASFDGSRLRLHSLEATGPLFDLSGRAQAALRGSYPIEAQLDWKARPPGYAVVEAATRLDGDLERFVLEQRLAAPWNLQLEAVVEDALDAPALDARLAVQPPDLAAVGGDLPAVGLDLQATVQGPVTALDVQARVNAAIGALDLGARELEAALAAHVAPDRVELETLALTAPETGMRFNADGVVALEQTPRADLNAQWQSLRWPLDGEAAVTSAAGRLAVDGTQADYRAELDTDLALQAGATGRVHLTAEGDSESAVADLSVDVLAGQLNGRAEVAWAPAVRADIELAGEGLDPAAVAADWPGKLSFSLDADGSMAGDDIRAELTRLTASGRLQDRPLSMEAAGRWSSGAAIVEVLDASYGATRLEAAGRIDERANLEWRLASPDLAKLVDGARGELAASGEVTGPVPRVHLVAEASGSNLAFQDSELESLMLDADIDLSGEARSRLNLTATDGQAGEATLERLELTGQGTPRSHGLALDVTSSVGSVNLALQGGFDSPWTGKPLWQFTLEEAGLAYGDLAPWRLAGPASGRVGATIAAIDRHCWRSGEARLCLEGAREPSGASGALSLSDFDFDYFASRLPATWQLTGSVDADASFAQSATGAPLTGSLKLKTSDGALSAMLPGEDDAQRTRVELLSLEPSSANVEIGAESVEMRVLLEMAQGELRIAGHSPATAMALDKRLIEGRVEVQIPEIAFLSPLLADVDNLAGSVGGRLEIGGSAQSPDIGGRIALENGTIDVTPLGLVMREATMAIEGRGEAGLGVNASARSGDGSIRMSGILRPFGEVPTGAIRVDGEAFPVIKTDDARIFASPELDLEASAERIALTGQVRVPRAEITPETMPESAVKPSSDVVLIEESEEDGAPGEAPTSRELYAKIRLILGDDVSFEGFGLKAQFAGDVQVEQRPGKPPSATGELRIPDGEYRAYGQGLVIDDGRIYFAGGPITRPALDIRAVRRPAEDILVGANVRGSLESPEFTLFSEPTMSQQEQLSWLVLGRSLETAPEGESSALSQAALAMGLQGGDFLAKNIGSRLGLDEVGIKTGSGEAGAASDLDQAQLSIGKYLAPNLYVSYGIGLFDPVQVLRMQYEITRNLKLITESSDDSSSGDIVYSIERGGGQKLQ